MVKLTNFPPPSEGIHCEQPDVEAYVKRKNLGLGKLYVAESRLSWVGNENGKGFSLEYPAISIHGVSRDTVNFPHECIYMMINCFIDEENEAGSDNDDEDPFTEIHLVPHDKAALNLMFQAMSTCSALHPDEGQETDSEFEDVEEEEEEEEGGGDGDPEYYTSAAGLANLSIQGQDNLARLENMFQGSGDNSISSNGVTMISARNSNGNSEEQSMEIGQFDDADS